MIPNGLLSWVGESLSKEIGVVNRLQSNVVDVCDLLQVAIRQQDGTNLDLEQCLLIRDGILP